MLVNMKTGEDLCNSRTMSSIPQQILYIEQEEIILIGSSQPGRSNNKCSVNIFKLINEEGLVGMESLKTYQFDGLLMDMQSFEFFDNKKYVVLGINSFVQVFAFKNEPDEDMLVPALKIQNQIGVFKIKVRKVDNMNKGWPPV